MNNKPGHSTQRWADTQVETAESHKDAVDMLNRVMPGLKQREKE